MQNSELTKVKIEKSLANLGNELKKMKIDGELILCGGAVMLLEYNSRDITKDIDAIFEPHTEIKELTRKIAIKNKLPDDWLNDNVKHSKSYINELRKNAEFYRQFGNLTVYKATLEQMIAMKLVAFRVGMSHDLEDLNTLIEKYNNDMKPLTLTTQVVKDIIIKQYGNLDKLDEEANLFIQELG